MPSAKTQELQGGTTQSLLDVQSEKAEILRVSDSVSQLQIAAKSLKKKRFELETSERESSEAGELAARYQVFFHFLLREGVSSGVWLVSSLSVKEKDETPDPSTPEVLFAPLEVHSQSDVAMHDQHYGDAHYRTIISSRIRRHWAPERRS